ncbi:MAG: type VI secretion system tip protein VgrG [Saprospiraceae bacterium]|nr:type VI secretion system tip protein VgrG [Saprospiraceae bacterium]
MPAPSPNSQKLDLVTVNVSVNGKTLNDAIHLQSIEVTREINKIAKAELVVLDGDPAKQDFEFQTDFAPGSEVKISLGYHQQNETVFEGIIVRVGVRIQEDSHSAITVQCADKAVKMSVSRINRYYNKQTDSNIISKIAGEAGLSKQVESTSYTHKEVIQYNTTDWDFILSRADLNGKVVVTENNKLIVEAPAVSGSAPISLQFGRDILSTDIYVDAVSQYTQVESAAWDMATQKLTKSTSSEPSVNNQGDSSIKGKSLADKMASPKYAMHVPAPIESSMLKTWADARLLRSRLARIRGTISCMGTSLVKPNSLVTIDRLSDYFTGDAYVSKVVHQVQGGHWSTEIGIGMDPQWFVESSPNVEIPSASGMLPGINGLYIGVVKKIHEDPDGDTRIQVDIPVLEQSSGIWARYASPYASKEAGIFFLPEIGDEVILGFLNNDPSYPMILGNLYSKKQKSPYAPDDKNSTKAIVTKNKLKVIFMDDKKNIVIETPAGNTIKLQDEDGKIIIQDKNKNLIEMSSAGIKMDTPKDLIITAKGKISIEATQNISIASKGGDITSEGLNVKTKAKIMATVEGSMAELKGSGQTTVKGGIVMIN